MIHPIGYFLTSYLTSHHTRSNCHRCQDGDRLAYMGAFPTIVPLQSALSPAAKRIRSTSINRSPAIPKIPPNPASDNPPFHPPQKRPAAQPINRSPAIPKIPKNPVNPASDNRLPVGLLKTKNQKPKTVQSYFRQRLPPHKRPPQTPPTYPQHPPPPHPRHAPQNAPQNPKHPLASTHIPYSPTD